MTNRIPFATAVLHQAAARCLAYPDQDLYADLELLRTALGHSSALAPFLDHLAVTPPEQLAAHYVQVFDFTTKHSLYLSWWTDGDTRRRGAALLAVKRAYRERGFEPTDEELPDFLPTVLEFCAATREDTLLREHRAGLELLRLALTEAGTPYAGPVAAVCATLPGPRPADRAQALALARSGPPREEVGLGPELPPYGHLAQLPVLSVQPGGH
ncbi:nitrate reductase molybdenum cofactor assembly chaperone [Kitasatospora sp. LaBMicrA B282]|uniref:nitrate reductase molybdenum cofactor assembly chaperone n=1 Tax=Kitasatospora sp. LaBMicrA B282 TaxID=3420949 RepID=UPI003D1120C7